MLYIYVGPLLVLVWPLSCNYVIRICRAIACVSMATVLLLVLYIYVGPLLVLVWPLSCNCVVCGQDWEVGVMVICILSADCNHIELRLCIVLTSDQEEDHY